MTRPWPFSFRRTRAAQRGSLIVTTFVIVIGLTIVLGGVNFLLKQQMEASLEIKKMSLGRLQALYLAEMGVNEFMYTATTAGALPAVPDTYNFKNEVAMTRDPIVGTATCTITSLGGGRYRATPTLVTPDGTFDIPWIITFTPSWNATDRVYELAGLEVVKK